MKKTAQTAAAAAAAAVMIALTAACGSGEKPEDRISSGDWRGFINEQVNMITRGEKLAPEVHELFCDGRRDIDELNLGQEDGYPPLIKRGDQARIMAYCAGVEHLIKK